jgi:hypothetical protein
MSLRLLQIFGKEIGLEFNFCLVELHRWRQADQTCSLVFAFFGVDGVLDLGPRVLRCTARWDDIPAELTIALWEPAAPAPLDGDRFVFDNGERDL